MCDKCIASAPELTEFIDQFIEKNPGTEVRGHKVPRSHHAVVALRVEFEKRWVEYVREAQELESQGPSPAQEQAADDVAQNSLQQAFAKLLRGNKISEGN